MANKRSLKTLGNVWLLELDSPPNEGAGFKAPIGSEARIFTNGEGREFIKFGSNDLDWKEDRVLIRYRFRDTASFSTNSTTYVTITDFSFIPVAGTYLINYEILSTISSNSGRFYCAIFKNEVLVADSEMFFDTTNGRYSFLGGSTELFLNGSTDTISLRVRTNTATITVLNRSFNLLRVE